MASTLPWLRTLSPRAVTEIHRVTRLLSILSVALALIVPATAQHPWTPTGLQNERVQCLGVNAAGELFAGIAGGLMMSTNEGESWDTVRMADFIDPFALLITPVEQTIFIAVESGVYRSTDNGSHWTWLGNDAVGVYSFARQVNGTLFGFGSSGVVRSTDNGDTWVVTLAQPGTFNDGLLVTDTTTVLGGAITGGLFRSGDNGDTWTLVTDVEGMVTSMAYDALSHRVFVATAIGHPVFGMWPFLIYRSTDNGMSWSQPDTMPGLVASMVADNRGGIIASCDTLLRSPDGANTWLPVDDSLPAGYRFETLLLHDGMLYGGDSRLGLFRNTTLLADSAVPPEPQLLSPPDDSTGIEFPLVMDWQSLPGCSGYWIDIAYDPLFSAMVIRDSTVVTSSATISLNDTSSTVYYWRVRARNSAGWGPWSDPRRFTTSFFSATISVQIGMGWNLVSLPVQVTDGRISSLFPGASSIGFRYHEGYLPESTLVTGSGYWVKFPWPQMADIGGRHISSDSIAVHAGWNLIGSVSDPVPVGSIASVPSGIVASPFYEFHGHYSEAAVIVPGKAYWVRVTQPGKLLLVPPFEEHTP